MDLRDHIAILKAHKWLVACCVLISLGASSLATIAATKEYASTTRLFISTSAADSDTQALQGGQYSIQRVKSYADLLTGREIAKRVADTLELDESPVELASQISASSKLDTVILNVTVTDPSPERAKMLVDAVAAEFVSYVAELETPPGKDQATIKATVVDAGTEPSNPVSPQPRRNLALGLVLGLLIGAGLAVLRDTLDTSIKGTKQLEDTVDAPLLGAVAYDPAAVESPLIHGLDPYAPRVEAFRVLRTNLQFIDPDQHHKVFVVSSSLPGEGKTTTATNLAMALAEGGERVALVEADLRRPKISSYLNVESAVGLTTILVGRAKLDDALQEVPSHPGLTILSSGRVPPNPAELLKSQAMVNVIAQLREQFDVVIIDAPPLLPVTDAALLASEADGAVLVVRHGKTTVDQVTLAAERLEAVGARVLGTILNMAPAKGADGYGYGYGYGYAPEEQGPGARKSPRRDKKGRGAPPASDVATWDEIAGSRPTPPPPAGGPGPRAANVT